MHASSHLTFSSALDESRSRRLLRRHRMHLPHPTRNSRHAQVQPEPAPETDSEPVIVATVLPSAPLDSLRFPSEPD